MKSPLLLALALAACSSSHGGGPDAAGTPDGTVILPDADGDAPPEPSKVYAHSGRELFRLDTRTNAPIDIGPFGAATGTASITDIAVDKTDQMTGITLSKVFHVDVTTGTATLLTSLAAGSPNLTSLSFVPTDLSDVNSPEILVAADTDGNIVQINPNDGTNSVIGSYGKSGNDTIRSSGDIVAVRGAGIFATVNVGDTLSDKDYLARIDPATWKATIIGSDLGADKVFGLGYWGGKLYGFVDVGAGQGAIIEINPTTGAVTPINSGSIEWFGAGVTTDAPIIVN